jgi:hydrogenase small subunit
MAEITRRNFLKLSCRLAALMGLGSGALPDVAEALERIYNKSVPALWLQGLSCSGCSISLLNSEYPGPARILTEYLSLLFHATLSVASGDTALQIVEKSREEGGYYLFVEGSVPVGMPAACKMGHEAFPDQLARIAGNAKAVIAVGTCACFGGIPAAEGNPTGAVSVPEFLTSRGISSGTIRVPGCPIHPDWLVGTLVHLLKFGMPPLDDKGRPKMFFSRTVHDLCPRFADYERERFANTFGEDGCLFKLGCAGPITHADCGLRQWNAGTNFCIKAGAPCIGCASDHFASDASFPFITKKYILKQDA